MPYAAHGVTHAGRRASNEDALLVDTAIGLFVVADGMGGHRAGEIASGLAVETIRSVMTGEPPTGDLLCHAVECANDQILAAASSNHHPPAAYLDLHRALERVPREARVLLALRYVDGLSYGELARIRGISINTVKSQLARGKSLLRAELGKRGADHV